MGEFEGGGSFSERHVTAADTAWIVGLHAAPHARAYMQQPDEDAVRAAVDRPGAAQRVVLDRHGAPIALWRARLEDSWLAELQTLVVAQPGKGAGTLALRRALAWAFDEQRVHRTYLYVTAANARARSLYELHGFRFEGADRDGFRAPDGTFQPLCRYGMLEDEYVRHRR